MSKPLSVPRWGTALADPGDIVEPLSGKKDIGWQDAEMPPHSYMNWLFNLIYQWCAYLDGLTGEALTWTAVQTFNAAVVINAGITINALHVTGAAQIDGTLTVSDAAIINDAGAGVDAALTVNGTFNKSGVLGNSGSSFGGYGVRGVGASRTGAGNGGTLGQGGTGTTVGGLGSAGLGGAGSGINSIGGIGGAFVGGAGGTTGVGTGGVGATATGGAIDGATNTTGAAGAGATITGGAVTADANGRTGGTGVKVAGGLGQAGYGPAIEVVHGDLLMTEGNINQVAGGNNQFGVSQVNGDFTVSGGDIIVTDDLTVGDNTNLGGTLAVAGITTLAAQLKANGGIELPAPSTVVGGVGFKNSYADATGLGSATVAFWKDAFGVVHMRGAAVGGASNAVAFTLPAGYRPTTASQFPSTDFGTNNTSGYTVYILTNGDVQLAWSGGNHAPTLDGISFRTT